MPPLLLALAAALLPSVGPGVVVAQVQPGFAAARAGLRPGDVLLRWERAASPPANPQPAEGALTSPFDVDDVEYEQAPRGEVALTGTRDGQPLTLRLPHDEWRLVTRPAFAGGTLEEYERARSLADGPERDRGLEAWRDLARRLREQDDGRTAAWLLWHAGRTAADERRWEQADGALAEAEASTRADADAALPQVLFARGNAAQNRSQWDRAGASYQEALEIYRAQAPGSLREARMHSALSALASARDDLDGAEAAGLRALALREAAAPRSLAVSTTLNNFGAFSGQRGDLSAAQSYLERALAIREERSPGGFYVAATLNNLGIVARRRGDLAGAEEYHRRALAIHETLEPDGIDVAAALHNLAIAEIRRGDAASATGHWQRALAIKRKRAPGSMTVASTLDALGSAAAETGDLAAAEGYHRQALEITSALAPGGSSVAASLASLGDVALRRGDLDGARQLLEQALAIRERETPASINTAEALFALGEVARAAGDLAAAEGWYRRALAIQAERAPGTAGEAEACERVAAIARRQGRTEEAIGLYRRALDALDAQRRFLGAADRIRSRFQARYAAIHHDAIDLLVEQGRAAEAFAVLERYRARTLLSLLAERDLVFAADVPAQLDRERRLANADYDRALARLSGGEGDAAARREALEQARRRQAAAGERIRAASPALFALQYPQPLDLDGVRARLDPGTLLLSYAVGETRSFVFAVGPGPDDFAAVPLAVGRRELGSDVTRFRSLLRKGGALQDVTLRRAAERIGRVLLGPVAAQVGAARRVLVLPDGPLHSLPFAALGDPASPGRFRYLIERRPIHLAASATTFAELAKGRRPGRAPRLLAFGDPDYTAAQGSAAASLLPRPREHGAELLPLPASRAEVAVVERLYRGSAQVFVGPEATEQRAKAADADVTVIHFATHGLVDEAAPLDSSLVLTLPRRWQPGDDNGLLQAWEVFEQMRIRADLVTLSACDSALGEEVSGEGILGLTRAFQYAGARAVLASLWGVNDASTAELMASFYAALGEGRSTDEALRAAQLHLLHGSRWRHPRHWAAFELLGDWR
jgi:CHAT domain-containing protein/Tfp pilus assembly protein PilF